MPTTPQKGLPTLLSNTLYLLMGNGASVLITMFLSMVLAQSLVPAGYGEYNFILAIVFPSMLIAEFGFSTLIVRELSGAPHLARPLLRRLLPLRLAISASVIVAVTGLVAAFVSTHHMSHLPFALPIILTYPFFAMVTAALRARQQMAWVSLLNVGLLIAQALWLVAARETLSIQHALFIYSATAAGQLVAALVVFWRMTKTDEPHHLTLNYAKWMGRCIPFAVANIVGALQLRLVLLLLGIHDYHIQMGFYAAATKFSDAARLLPMAYFDAIFPRLSARRSDPLAVHRMRRQVIFATLAYSLLASGLMLWLAQPLILLVFGSMYLPSADILSLLALIFVPATLHAALRLEAYATGYEWVANGVSISLMGILYTSAVFGDANGVYNLLRTSLILETTACIVLGFVLFSGVSLKRASTTIPYTPAK